MDISLSSAVTVRASAENLPFRDQTFNLVFAGEVLEHLNAPARALNEWTRVLRIGGTLCLSTPMHFPVPSSISYDLFLAGVKDPDAS